MTEHEKYQEHIRHTHDAFCKTVIRHAAIDAARSIRSRRKREISLEYLIEEKHYPFSTTDKYFTEQSGMNSYPLFVCGQMPPSSGWAPTILTCIISIGLTPRYPLRKWPV